MISVRKCENHDTMKNTTRTPRAKAKLHHLAADSAPLTYYVQVSSARGCNIARQATPCQDQYGALLCRTLLSNSRARSLMPSTSALTSRPHYHPSLFRLSGTSSNSSFYCHFILVQHRSLAVRIGSFHICLISPRDCAVSREVCEA